jgi:hypothetical protein
MFSNGAWKLLLQRLFHAQYFGEITMLLRPENSVHLRGDKAVLLCRWPMLTTGVLPPGVIRPSVGRCCDMQARARTRVVPVYRHFITTLHCCKVVSVSNTTSADMLPCSFTTQPQVSAPCQFHLFIPGRIRRVPFYFGVRFFFREDVRCPTGTLTAEFHPHILCCSTVSCMHDFSV